MNNMTLISPIVLAHSKAQALRIIQNGLENKALTAILYIVALTVLFTTLFNELLDITDFKDAKACTQNIKGGL
jgi:hypothetical protein